MKKDIINFLKTQRSDIGGIIHALNLSGRDAIVARDVVHGLVKEGIIRLIGDQYAISSFLSAPILRDRKEGLYNYQRVQELISNVPAQSRPSRWINDNAYRIARRDQGDRGTCVGQATAYAFDLNMMKLTNWQPDLTQVQRDIVMTVHDHTLIKDELPEGSASADCIYFMSRELGNVTAPSGSYLEFASKVWRTYGICFENQWWTSKSPSYGNISAYPSGRIKCLGAAAPHIIDGYSTSTSFEAIKDAIYKTGFVLMPINIYENWLDNNREGLFPDPKGNLIGSHALCWVGFDEDHIYCLHSWTEWSLLGGISRKYFDQAAQAAWIPLDSVETEYAKQLYVKFSVTSESMCNITINGDLFKNVKEAKGSFERGTRITVSAESEHFEPWSTEVILSQDTFIAVPQTKKNIVSSICSYIRKRK